MAVPGGHQQVVANGYVVLGTSVTGNMDLITFYGTNGDWATLQAQAGGGVALETGGPTKRSSIIPMTAGHRYSFSLLYDEVNGLGQLNIYDPSTGFSQVGHVTSAMPKGNAVANLNVGNIEAGTASTTTFFEDVMLDWTNHTFPQFPH
jgi:hypothetical protein